MIDTSEIKKGIILELDGNPYTIVDFQFVNPGKGSAFTRTKMKNVFTGSVLERTFKSGERLETADVEERNMEFIYTTGEDYTFMDTANHEQVEIPLKKIEEEVGFLLQGFECKVLFYKGEPAFVTLPIFVEIVVKETGPSDKGNTVTTSFKPAILESGGTIQVPMFVKEGDRLKIDTRTKTYVERL